MNSNILLTGSSGFVGGALLQALENYKVICFGRSKPKVGSAPFVLGMLNQSDQIINALTDVEVVIHSAARAHVMNEEVGNPIELYRDINTRDTLTLAEHAAAQGVKRFIFISSIKVNGESTDEGKPFTSDSLVNPTDPYGISKCEAEVGLKRIAAETGLEVVIIRPPLVYGPGVKANFASMMKLAKRNLPLPLGAINNKRSLVALGNLVDLIVTCISHPNAANQVFLVSDDHDVSTTELLEMMTLAAGKNPRLIPVPKKWLGIVCKLFGKQAIIERLCGNLQVDITHTKETLNWQPPVSFEQGIKRCFDD